MIPCRSTVGVAVAVWAAAAAVAWAVMAGISERLQFADGLYKRGMYAMAIREYADLLATAEDDADIADVALFRMGESHRFLEENEDAIAAYSRLLADHPDSLFADRAAFRRAELALATGDPARARTWFEALIVRGPSDDIAASAHYYRGLASLRLGEGGAAEASFETVLDDYGASPFAAYAAMALAEQKAERGLSSRGIRPLYRRVAEQPETPAQGAEALARWLDLEWDDENHDEVIRLFERLAATYPDDPRVTAAAHRAALAALQTGASGQALELTDRYATRDDAPERWAYIRANALRMQGEADAAGEAYRTFLDQAEGEVRRGAAIEYASLLIDQEQYATALNLLEPLAAEGSRAADRRWMLAIAYSETGRLDEAEDLFQAVLADPDQNPRHAAARFELARVAQRAGNDAEAVDRYAAFAETHPDNDLAPLALDQAASAAVVLGDHPRAITLWQQRLEAYPDAPDRGRILYRLAGAQIEDGRREDAKAVLEELIRSFPRGDNAAEAHYQRGQLVEEDGDLEVADYHYLAALRLQPEDPLVSRLRFRRIAVLQRLDRGAEAAEMLKTLLSSPEVPAVPEPLVEWLARWNLEQERYGDAAQAAVHLAETSTDPAWQQRGWLIAGAARYRDGLLEDAVIALNRAAGAPPAGREQAEAALLLGEAYAALGQTGEAEAAFRSAAEKAAGDANLDLRADASLALADLYRGQENWDEAVRLYLSVAVLFDDPDRVPRALDRAAEAFGQLGRDEDRRETLRELVERYPDHPLADAAGEILAATEAEAVGGDPEPDVGGESDPETP